MVIGTVVVRCNDFNLSRDLTRPRGQRVMQLYRQKPIKVGYDPVKFDCHGHSDSGDSGFSLSRDLSRPHDQRVMQLYRQEPIKVSYHLAKFVSHRS